MKIKFWGAAQTVTGSSHLLEIGERRVLLDCGMYQGSRALAREINTQFAVEPATIDTMVLSHAHIDHCGNIPRLVKQGYNGRIYCTAATYDLARILLRDSAKIQESDAKFLNKKLKRRGEPPVQPQYTMEDAERSIELLRPKSYHERFVPSEVCEVDFFDAGHILGSAWLRVKTPEGKTLVFSGDVGRRGMPILLDPELPGPADTLILESTYGGRIHDDFALAEEQLCEALQRVIKRGGKIVIPAFSVGRTQEIVYALNNLWNRGELERVPVYVDSPLSADATEIFRAHPECYDDETKQVLLNDPDPFGFEGMIYVRDVKTSKSINRLNQPCVIISASGMCEAGRVLHHLANTVDNPRNAVLIVGFQAQNTLGRRIVEKHPEIKIFGELHKLLAEVFVFNAFSAHGDERDLTEFAKSAATGGKLKKIFLVHGEMPAATALREKLLAEIPGVEVHIPARGEIHEV